MSGRQALSTSSLAAKKGARVVRTLEQIAMEQYLMLLQVSILFNCLGRKWCKQP
jgi:hypothetical protein